MIKYILWDVDNTLLDFYAAEKAAIKTLFKEFNLGECSDEMIERYSYINTLYWQKLERKEMTKPEILVARFKQFFEEYNIISNCAKDFNAKYQITLGDTIVFRDDSYNIVKSFIGKYKQFVVSNGTIIAQNKKLKNSGLGEMMDGIYLSEQIGVEKPDIRFFDYIFKELNITNKNEVIIIGDSLTSDIQGGINAGIKTCWYNPFNSKLKEGMHIDYEIKDLHEIYDILIKENK